MGRFLFASLGLILVTFSLSGIGAGHQCPFGSFSHNMSCYKLFKIWRSWDDAQKTCKKELENGQLASIEDDAVAVKLSNYIAQTSKHCGVWMGLKFSETKGEWEWIDGSNSTYRSWEEGEPNNFWNHNEFCAMLTRKSRYLQWNDKNCKYLHPFVCKF